MAPIESLSVSLSCRHLPAVPARDVARVVVWLRGEHDLSTVPELSTALAQAISLDDSDVLVDLRDVEFMGAATVDVLHRGSVLLAARSRRLVLRSPPSCVRRVLRVLELFGETDVIDPVEAGPVTGGALGSWVPVPATGAAEVPAAMAMAPVSSVEADRGGRARDTALVAGPGVP